MSQPTNPDYPSDATVAYADEPYLSSVASNAPPADAISLRDRLTAVKEARNPLLEAARPLLRALADMPKHLQAGAGLRLRELLEQEVRSFRRLCEQSNIRRDHMIGASYCLCTALDESVGQTSWGHATEAAADWIRKGLASTFHEDTKGGDKTYLLIGRLLSDTQEHRDLLEVIYRILSLGFIGRYRYDSDGTRKHDAVRQRLYTEITAGRDALPMSLSPHWQSDARRKRMSLYDFPVWLTFIVLAASLLGLFGVYKYQLMTRGAEVQKQIADIGHLTPRPAPTMLHLKELLKNEIAAGTVSVDEDAGHSAVTFRGDAMFQPGGAAVKTAMSGLIAKIAGEIVKVPGKVTVLGYTDNVPIRSRAFASNQMLSEERAAQVMQMLQSAGVAANRLTAEGKGEADPIGDNRTAQGRAQNRRVAIVVTP
ncbi:type VI secretion system protein TssL, long form [Caballeronia sp. S22]|uniref:type VI secretion system protein TssL, long form n=1 Tax=Caballeronia sp. S22 TaxID=3137182 RepID=UPI003530851F